MMSVVGTGVVGPGHAEFFDIALESGHSYLVDVQPTQPDVDFDLRVFDENGNLITEDITTAPDAYCRVTPRWTGPFRFVVNSEHGTAGYQIRVQE
jgi:MarR-like DNA-binding transcriptional regulator SgrR of sgrS sRNA